jgi:hypothetical protein
VGRKPRAAESTKSTNRVEQSIGVQRVFKMGLWASSLGFYVKSRNTQTSSSLMDQKLRLRIWKSIICVLISPPGTSDAYLSVKKLLH